MGWRPLRRHPDLAAAAVAWVEARLYVAVAFVITDAVLERAEPPRQTPIDLGLLAWDGDWYRRIAEHGYESAADPAVRFFPLWPMLGRWGSVLLGGPDVALVVLANLLALVGAVLLYRIALEETGDSSTAVRAVRLFSLFPTAFVLVMGYSEALFAALAMTMLLALRRERWWTAAALGYLVGLTRPVGALLGLSALVCLRRSGGLRCVGGWAAALSGLAGTATYLAYCRFALDDAWAPFDRQRELRGGFAEPVSRLIRAAADGVAGDKGEAFHFLAAVLIVGLTMVCVRRLSPELWVFAAASTLVSVSVENLNSIERYALGAFPLVIAAAIASRSRLLDRWVVTASAVAMTSMCVLAVGGAYVP